MRLSVNEKAKLKIMLKIIILYFAFKGAVSEFGKSPSLIELLMKWLFVLFSCSFELVTNKGC